MARVYGSFMLRCWRLPGGDQRIEIEHMQSGERTRVTSLPAAVAWIDAHCGQPAAATTPADAAARVVLMHGEVVPDAAGATGDRQEP